MIAKKGIIFGPWVGEFGWELFAWQAYCRAISKKFDFAISISRPGNDYLYQDFSDIYLPFQPPDDSKSDSFMNSSCNDFDMKSFLMSTVEQEILTKYEWTWVTPQRVGFPPYTHWMEMLNIEGFNVVPQYKLFGREPCLRDLESYDIVIHARNRKIRKNDNWEIKKWDELVAQFNDMNLTVACIGRKNSSEHIPGAVDFRDVDLKTTVALMSSAKCTIGPSSGPIHLATLCGCPQITWTNHNPKNFSEERYKYTWNPFMVKSVMLNSENPNVSEIIESFINL